MYNVSANLKHCSCLWIE